MPVTTRPAEAHDLAAMTAIHDQGIRDGVATFEPRERAPDELAPWLGDPAHPVLAADDGDACLGWVAAPGTR